MRRLPARRLIFVVFVLWGVTLITFFLARVAPGDPARLIAGRPPNAAATANVHALYGLDQPLVVQYGHYMGDLLRGDLGTSFVTRRPVAADIGAFLPATAELSLFALLAGSSAGIALCVFAALRRGSRSDTAARLIAVASLSMPAFLLVILAP